MTIFHHQIKLDDVYLKFHKCYLYMDNILNLIFRLIGKNNYTKFMSSSYKRTYYNRNEYYTKYIIHHVFENSDMPHDLLLSVGHFVC